MADEYKLIDDKLKEMQPVFDRMDKDQDLYFLKPYVLTMPGTTAAIPDVVNVTLNDPLLFATKAIAIMGGATMQTVVEGADMRDKQTTKIEEFLDDDRYMIDEWLTKRGILGLDAFVNEQICVRGRIIARSCPRIDKEGNFIPDLVPIDARSFVHENDADGMVWGAGIYTRTKAQIEKEYGKAAAEGISTSGQVRDFWDAEQNIVYVGKNKVNEQKNPYGSPPFVESICPIGSMFSTEEAAEHEGESIFWANRELWQQKNACASILQTLNVMSLFAGLQFETSSPGTAGKPSQSPWKMRTVTPVEKGGGYKPLPLNDIKNATRLFYAVLDASLQRGSLAVIDYGSLTFPLSAVAITKLSGSRDDIFLPRVQAKAVFFQSLSRMRIEQCQKLDKSIDLGQPGNRNSYTKSDLGGDYTIQFRFFTESKEQTAADLSIASAAKGFLSSDTIRRTVLHLEDPDGEEAKWLSEQAENMDDVLFLYRRASKLIDEEKPLEAFILAQRIVVLLKQRQAQGIPAASANEPTAGKPVLPLFAGARGARSTASAMPNEPNAAEELNG